MPPTEAGRPMMAVRYAALPRREQRNVSASVIRGARKVKTASQRIEPPYRENGSVSSDAPCKIPCRGIAHLNRPAILFIWRNL
jgi:hypothetical protein